ncbi:MAG: hypothetical protein RMK45_10215 [Armatimonadota bacterium]|nr:hypothetical protein [Armatimonadota bacterium]
MFVPLLGQGCPSHALLGQDAQATDCGTGILPVRVARAVLPVRVARAVLPVRVARTVVSVPSSAGTPTLRSLGQGCPSHALLGRDAQATAWGRMQ